MASSESSEEKLVDEKREKKMVIHMNIAAHQLLSKLLRPKSPEHDWESLAELMGYGYEEIVNLGYDQDPVESIIRQWERKSDATIDKLLSLLQEIGRPDVIEDLQQFIDKTPTAAEHEQKRKKVLEDYSQSPAAGKLPIELERLTVSDEIFDGFICYAKEDRSFANEILTKLEAPPYCRKICIDYRDYVPGNCKLDQTAKIIEHRCKHLVAIMSQNFTSSSNAGFQVRIALNLSPDFRKRRVIPILYEKCDIPEILKPIYYLNYEEATECPHFWKRLAVSLGYIEESPQIGKNRGESPRGSPYMGKRSSPGLNKKNSKLSERKASPSIEKKPFPSLFNIIKPKK